MKNYKVVCMSIAMFLTVFLIAAYCHAADAQVVFSWQQTNPENVTHWTLKVGTTDGGPYAEQTFMLLKSDFDDSGVYTKEITMQSPAFAITTHYAVMSAGNDTGESADSPQASVSIDRTQPPSAPFQLQMGVVGG